jgi:hypothetical protein
MRRTAEGRHDVGSEKTVEFSQAASIPSTPATPDEPPPNSFPTVPNTLRSVTMRTLLRAKLAEELVA